jgi:hypothetical protein
VQHHDKGHWKGWALKIETFLGPEMARAKPQNHLYRAIKTTGTLIVISGFVIRIVEVRETFATLSEISRLLNTGLDQDTLVTCVRLCEQVSRTPQRGNFLFKGIVSQDE